MTMQGTETRREQLDRIFGRSGWISLRRACEYLSIAPRTLHNYLAMGIVDADRIPRLPGGHYRFDRSALEYAERAIITDKGLPDFRQITRGGN